MKRKTLSRCISGICFLVPIGLFLGGCATMGEKPKSVLTASDRGTVLYEDKYEFKPPSPGWSLMRNLVGGDFEFGFLKVEKGEFPSQTTMFYDEEPYGSSLDLATRAREYSVFFLAGRGMSMAINKMEKGEVAGRPALVVYMEGENPYRNEKARSSVHFFKTGDYVVTLACTQWRAMKGAFDPESFEHFKIFVQSFKFLKRPFYEEIEERIKRVEG
jgi:hypothetical protein